MITNNLSRYLPAEETYLANIMARCASARRAMTLFELIAVVFIIGIVSLMAVTRFSATTLADIGAQPVSPAACRSIAPRLAAGRSPRATII